MRVAVVAEYYPRPSRSGLGHLGTSPGAGGRARTAWRCASLVLDRPLPSRSDVARAAAIRDRSRSGRAGSSTRTGRRCSTACRSATCGSSRRRARWSYASWGRWARAAGPAGARPRLAARTSSTPTTRCPPATRRCAGSRRGNDVPLVVSVHGGDLSYTAAAQRARPRGRRAGAARRRRGDRQQRGHPPRDRGADRPAAGARGDPSRRRRAGGGRRARRRADARDRRPPRAAQEPGRRDPRAGGAEGPPSRRCATC